MGLLIRPCPSSSTQQRILTHYFCGYKLSANHSQATTTREPSSQPGRNSKVLEETRCIQRHPGAEILTEIKRIGEQQMQVDDETIVTQLHCLLQQHGYKLSLQMDLCCQSLLGLTSHGSAYCQLIRDMNKQKWLAQARQYFEDDFLNMMWTDECSVQMESHNRFQDVWEASKPKQRWVYVYVQYILACKPACTTELGTSTAVGLVVPIKAQLCTLAHTHLHYSGRSIPLQLLLDRQEELACHQKALQTKSSVVLMPWCCVA